MLEAERLVRFCLDWSAFLFLFFCFGWLLKHKIMQVGGYGGKKKNDATALSSMPYSYAKYHEV